MGLFAGVDNSSIGYASEACAKAKEPSDKWQKGFERGPPIGHIPKFFYSAFLGREDITEEQMLGFALSNAKPKLLEEILPFVQDKNLKKKIYENIRSRIFSFNRSNSIIVNELTGLFDFAKKSALYGIATFRMHIGK